MADTEAGMEAGPITADFVMPPAPSIPPEQALRLLRRHYGLQGRARPLDSERDRIFHIVVEDGRDYLLRLANPAETPEVSSLQTAVLAHIATRAPGLPVQRILPPERIPEVAALTRTASVRCAPRSRGRRC